MKLDATKLGLASGGAFAIIWLICSVLVMLIPTGMMEMTGQMMHADLSTMQWHIGIGGVVLGAIAWSLVAGVTGWLIATIYNRLNG